MRFTVQQLMKLRLPYSYEEDLDLSEDLVGFEDILAVSSVHVEGTIKELMVDSYQIDMTISCKLTMQCARSLEKVLVDILTSKTEIYSNSIEGEDIIKIDNDTLDTKEAVITNILIEKPMSVVSPNAAFNESDVDNDKEEEYINPAFRGLKDIL